jgi:hypothetical protein
MTKAEVKAVLDRVLTWPAERQEAAARLLSEMEVQDASSLVLSDEQVAEVQHRLADLEPKFLTLEEVRGRFAHRRA